VPLRENQGGRGEGWALLGNQEKGLVDSCTTQLKVQGPSRTCNESKEEESGEGAACTLHCPSACGAALTTRTLRGYCSRGVEIRSGR